MNLGFLFLTDGALTSQWNRSRASSVSFIPVLDLLASDNWVLAA